MHEKDKTYLLKQNESLFEATLEEFSSKPYDLASTNVIIKNSDYNKGSFYYRFKTKEDIYYALIDYVYTLGIAILNANEIKLYNIHKEEELVELLFLNLKKLWEQDKRYYNILRRIYRESFYLKESISVNCIESPQNRITNRLLDLLTTRKYPYPDIFFNTLNSLLYDYFEGFDYLKTNLKDIKDFLFNKNYSYKLEPVRNKIDLSLTKGNQSYVVIDNEDVDLSEYNEYLVSGQLLNKQITLSNIRNTLKIKKITLSNIIDAGIKKSLRDLTYFVNLKSLDFANTSYHLLKYSEQIALLIIYNSFIGREYIILDNLISNYNPKEIEILFNHILPKTAKLSKIVVIDNSIYPSFTNNFYIYTFKNGILKELNTKYLVNKPNEYQVNYYEDNLLKTKLFHKEDEQLVLYIKNKKIKNILSNYKIVFKDIEESKR